tara:strand:+ start:279 stop:1259 length:981 start_codon:yes stop_codon:yes gene_type:complete
MESGKPDTPQLGLGRLLESLNTEDLQALLLSQAKKMRARSSQEEANDPARKALKKAKSLMAKSRPVRAASALSEVITGEGRLSSLLATKEAQMASNTPLRGPFDPAPAVAGALAQNNMGGNSPVPPPSADANFARGDSARFDTEIKPLSTTPSSNPTVVSTPTRVAESISPASAKVANYDYASMDPYAAYGVAPAASPGLSMPDLSNPQLAGLAGAGLIASSPAIKAKRDIAAVRRAYNNMAAHNIRDRGAVNALNKELKLLGSKSRLSGNTASASLARAELQNAERSIASTIRNSRLKRILPLALIAAAAPKIYQEFQRGSQYEY